MLQSTSRWKLLVKESTLLHGVKRGTSILNPTSAYDVNYDMWALEPKYCVNPHDITAVPQENEPVKIESRKEEPDISQRFPLSSYCRSMVKRETTARSPVQSRAQSPGLLARPMKNEEESLLENSCALMTGQPIVQQCATIKSETLNLYRANTAITNTAIPNTCSIKSEEASLAETKSSVLITDLENFQDLTEWCQRTPKAPNMAALRETDELNTPLIEFGEEFLFTSPTILNAHNNITPDDDDCYGLFNVAATPGLAGDFYACAGLMSPAATTTATATMLTNNKFNVNSDTLFECTNTAATATVIGNDCNVFNATNAEYEHYSNVFINDISGGGEVTEHVKPCNNVLNLTSNSTFTDNYNHNLFTTTAKCADILYNTTTTTTSTTLSHHQQQQQQQEQVAGEEVFTLTPVLTATAVKAKDAEMSFQFNGTMDSANVFRQVSSLEASNGNDARKNLRLDFSNLWMENKSETPTIDTPEVINTALAMDKDGFNLLKFIENDSIVSVDLPPSAPRPEEDADDQSQSPSTSNDPTYSSTDVSDDEDYEPPWKKRARLSAKSIKKSPSAGRRTSTSTRTSNSTVDFSSIMSGYKRDSADSEVSNVSTVESVKVVRRGRPPKRNISISSESTNADNEVSRYRELRDKNNEASRRSRLNRKMKEQSLEQEGNNLENRNRKLKVRVAELDKLVNTMRNNLMQMLLKK